jgi:hypothetical protein
MKAARELITIIRANQETRDFKYYAALVAAQKNLIPDLLTLCLDKEYPFPQYSSWLLAHVAGKHTELLTEFQPQLIDIVFQSPDQSVQRNISGALLNFPRIAYKEGEWLELLFHFLQDPQFKVALKSYSMQLIVGFLEDYPELKGELKSILETGMEEGSPAYRAGARKVLKYLEKQKNRNK